MNYTDSTSQDRAEAYEAVRAFVKSYNPNPEVKGWFNDVYADALSMLGAIASYMYNDADTLHIDCERRSAERHALGAIADSDLSWEELLPAAQAALAIRDQPVSERPYAQRQKDSDGVMWYDPSLAPGEDFSLKHQASNAGARCLAAGRRGDKEAARAHYNEAVRLTVKWADEGGMCEQATAKALINLYTDAINTIEGGAE